MTPFGPACTLESRVIDAGQPVVWNIALVDGGRAHRHGHRHVRARGRQPHPGRHLDGVDAGLRARAASRAGTGRYAQYKADLSTTDPAQTPVLRDVTIGTLRRRPPTS